MLSGIANTGNTEKSIVYDNLGNIRGLQRYLANTAIDQLKYDYTGNQLTAITDSTSSNVGVKAGGPYSYTYDGNGNMVTDASKGLSITYNILDLPNVNTLSGGTVSYVYDAAGTKLQKLNTIGGTTNTDYINGIQYTNGSIEFVQTEEGRALNSSGSYSYEYNLADNLGNNRLSFNSSGATTQQDNYLPFGYDINVNFNNPKNNYLYNRKELQTELGQYDYNTRFYDPVLGRFTAVDKFADKYPWYTQYQFAGNEVPNAIDKDGLEPAYPVSGGTTGRWVIARDGQLQRPLTDPEGAAYVNSKTQIGGTYQLLQNVSDAASMAGTGLQATGYVAALFTGGSSLSLVGIGEAFDLVGAIAGAANDYAKGDVEHAAITVGTTIAFGAMGKKLESLETAGKLASHEKTILAAGLTTTSKLLDKGLEGKKEEKEKPQAKADATSVAKPKIEDVKFKEVNSNTIQNYFKQANQ